MTTNERRQYLSKLYAQVTQAVPSYTGATITKLQTADSLTICIKKSATDLQRLQDMPFSSSYLYSKQNNSATPLQSIPAETSNLLSSTSQDGTTEVRFRQKDKDIFAEVWDRRGFVSSLKVTDKLSKVYNDLFFGGVSWSRDGRKVVFIGE